MSRVFIPQVPMKFDPGAGMLVPKFDTLNAAKEYGELVVLIDQTMALSGRPDCIDKICRGLSDYVEGDFFLPMGSHFFMMIAAICIANKTTAINILEWNQRDQSYRRTEVKTSQLKRLESQMGRRR